MRSIKIFQTNHHEYRFMNFDYFMDRAGFVDIDSFNYREVYASQFELSSDDMVACEQIYVLLNNHHPENYQARSLSVSDIISLDGKLYFVDSVGFVLLEQKNTAASVFGKCMLNLKGNHYYHEVLDLLDEVSAETKELDLTNCHIDAVLRFDSSYGISIQIGVMRLGEISNIATLYTSEMSKKAFQLMGELCGALAYELSEYVESLNKLGSAA